MKIKTIAMITALALTAACQPPLSRQGADRIEANALRVKAGAAPETSTECKNRIVAEARETVESGPSMVARASAWREAWVKVCLVCGKHCGYNY